LVEELDGFLNSSICDAMLKHFVSHVYSGHISLPSLEKKILEFAFKVDLPIRLQNYATAWSDKHIKADKHAKISWYQLNVYSVAETLSYYRKIIKRIKVNGENMTTTRSKWQEARLSKVRGNSGIATHSGTEFTA
jgi:hypothetical protein